MRQPFDGYPIAVRRFFSQVFNHAVINLYAVQHGHFDILISDMNDFYDIREWYTVYPKIINIIQEENERNKDGY